MIAKPLAYTAALLLAFVLPLPFEHHDAPAQDIRSGRVDRTCAILAGSGFHTEALTASDGLGGTYTLACRLVWDPPLQNINYTVVVTSAVSGPAAAYDYTPQSTIAHGSETSDALDSESGFSFVMVAPPS